MTTSPPLSLPDDDHDAGDVFRGTIPPAERDGYVPTPAITQFQCYKYDDENDVIKDKFSFFRSCAKCYEASGNMPDVLFSMAIGTLKNYEKIMEEPPFSKTRKKAHTSAFQPCLKRLVQEVLRRSHFFIAEYKVEDERHPLWNHRYKKAVVPRPSQWIRAALIDWLKSNILPARIEDDEFLESEVTRFSQNLARALEEEERDKVAAAAAAAGSQSGAPFCKARTGRSSVVPNRETDQYAAAGSQSESGAQIWKATTGWSCVVPNLRLIQIVLRPELLAHYETGDRTQQERTTHGARGTQQEVMSFWERVMLLFNNKDFKLDSSPIDSSWGGRFFIEPIQLNWEQLDEVGVTSLETPFAAKQKYTLLTNQLGNVYHKWKRSGSGQVRVDDEAIADQLNEDAASPPCEVEVQRNLMLSGGDRFRFLGDFNPAIMYLWYMLEKQRELFLDSMGEVDPAYTTDGSVGPSALGSSGSKSNKTVTTIIKQGTDQITSILDKHCKTQEGNMNRFFNEQARSNKKRPLQDYLLEVQRQLFRARENADNEEFNGNEGRKIRWLDRAREFEEEILRVRKNIDDMDGDDEWKNK